MPFSTAVSFHATVYSYTHIHSFSVQWWVAVVTVLLVTHSALFGLRTPTLDQTKTKPSADVSSRPKEVINVMFGLSGNHPGFLAEFEVALKSVLLNGPVSDDLAVHVLADGNAYVALPDIFKETRLEHSIWRNQVSITVYNVDPFLKNWSATVESVLHIKADQLLHTVGSFFRLFGHDILPKTVQHVIYLDTDVVVMANLAELWHSKDEDAVFMLGSDLCDGFMILNLYKGSKLWELAARIDIPAMRKEFPRNNIDDNLLLKGIHRTYPAEATLLPDSWSISVANGAWKYAQKLVEVRPAVGMLHFNGGGMSKDPYFVGDFFLRHPNSFGICRYCKFIEEETYRLDRPLVINSCQYYLFHSFKTSRSPGLGPCLLGRVCEKEMAYL